MGGAQVHIDLKGTGFSPDGAVVDAAGNLWNAQWGAGRVARYDPMGNEVGALAFPAPQTSCPAFGSEDLRTLFCTSAAIGLPEAHFARHPDSGRTFAVETAAQGQREHRVIV